MNDVNTLFEDGLPGLGNVFLTLLIGLLIGLVYNVLKRIIIVSLGQGQSGVKWRTRLELIERVFWPALVVAVLMSLLISRPLVGLVISAIIVIAFFNPMRNFILGLIFKSGKTYTLGQRIKYLNQNGSIRAFNKLSLELELEDGAMLDIPYLNFSNSDVIRSSPKSGVLSHEFDIQVLKPCDIIRVKKEMHSHLLAMPYVLPAQKIVFEQLSENSTEYVLKVIIHGIDKEQMYEVESKFKRSFGAG